MIHLKFSTGAIGLVAVFSSSALPPESEKYRQRILATPALAPTELREQFATCSFASIWLHSEEAAVYGFIGPDYQRLRIKLLTVKFDANHPGHYLVTGKSKVGSTVAAFSGDFRVLHVREGKGLPRTLDNQPTVAVKAGIVLAEYELREVHSQPRTGVFRGLLHTKWYRDRHGKLHYDDLQNFSDNYANNQFVGTWQSYRSGVVKRCNWGDYRIPNSGDLDQGAGEFSPAAKYLGQGWEAYRGTAPDAENATWWK